MIKPNLTQRADIAVQMTLHPRDAALAARTLPHQLIEWGPYCDRIILTIDSRPTIDCRGQAFRTARKDLFVLLDALRKQHRGLGIDSVVYADHYRRRIADIFFGGAQDWPDHAVDGSPFYAAFFGLMRTNARLILRLAPDALFEGDHGRWLAAARERLQAEAELLALAPAPAGVARGERGEASLLLDMGRLVALAAPLAPLAPGLHERLGALVLAREAKSRPALAVIAAGAARAGLAIAVDESGGLAPAASGASGTRERGRLGKRLKAGTDLLLGAQLKRLGRI